MRGFTGWILLTIMLSLQGCVYFNEEGVGGRKYRDCDEYYDAEGYYHKTCDPNLLDYDEFRLRKGDR